MRPIFFPYKAAFNASVPHLRVAIVQVEPYMNKKRVGDQVEVWGALSSVAAAIQSLSGHKFSVVSIEDMAHGYRLKNGSFYGIMSLFERGEIDLFISPALMTEERFLLAVPTTFEITSYQLLTWSPLKVVDPFNFAAAFTWEVWMSVLLSFLVLSLICWIMDRFLTPWNERKPFPLTEYVWDLFTRFFPQDAPAHHENWFRMCLIGFLLSLSLIFMTFLSSALTSSMTIKSDEDYVNSYADVLRFPKVRIYSEKGTVFTRIFTDPNTELFRKLKSRVLPVRGIFKLSPQVDEIVREVEEKRGVVVGSPDICKSLIITVKKRSGKCPDVMLSTDNSGLMTASLFISRNLPMATRELINRAVMIALESHLYRQALVWSMDEYERCRLRTRSDASFSTKPLSVLDVQGCFVLFALGICAAGISFTIEISGSRCFRRP